MADRHDSHDLEAMVAFADGELAGPEQHAAAERVRACRDCADLVADLRSIAFANRAMVVPARPRGFRLSTADAERLGRLGPEPEVVATRLGLDMTATPATLSDHATHDPELIAAAVGDVLDSSQRRVTETWLSTCRPCAELHADLLAIASAGRALPVPTRPRDYRLTPADARRLQPRGFRAILAAIGSSRDAFSKPLAVGLTTLGLVGLLVGTIPSFGMGGSASVILSTVGAPLGAYGEGSNGGSDTQSENGGDGSVFGGQDSPASAAPSAAALPAAAGPEDSVSPSAAASAAAPPLTAASPAASSAPASPDSAIARDHPGAAVTDKATGEGSNPTPGDGTDGFLRLSVEPEAPSGLLIASVLMLIVGLGLFAARWAARRLRTT